MGIKDVKAAFEETLGRDYSCSIALLDNQRDGNGVESQVLFFRGNDPTGAEFEIRSDPIMGGASPEQAARDTAMTLLNQKKP